jgi:hypothetical protein
MSGSLNVIILVSDTTADGNVIAGVAADAAASLQRKSAGGNTAVLFSRAESIEPSFIDNLKTLAAAQAAVAAEQAATPIGPASTDIVNVPEPANPEPATSATSAPTVEEPATPDPAPATPNPAPADATTEPEATPEAVAGVAEPETVTASDVAKLHEVAVAAEQAEAEAEAAFAAGKE